MMDRSMPSANTHIPVCVIIFFTFFQESTKVSLFHEVETLCSFKTNMSAIEAEWKTGEVCFGES